MSDLLKSGTDLAHALGAENDPGAVTVAALVAALEAAERKLHYIECEGWNCQSKLEHTVTQWCSAAGIEPCDHHRLADIAAALEAATKIADAARAYVEAESGFNQTMPINVRKLETLNATADELRAALALSPATAKEEAC